MFDYIDLVFVDGDCTFLPWSPILTKVAPLSNFLTASDINSLAHVPTLEQILLRGGLRDRGTCHPVRHKC